MKIKEKTFQMRNDFSAILICEFCKSEQVLDGGYNDSYYYNNVLPEIHCNQCGKDAHGKVDLSYIKL